MPHAYGLSGLVRTSEGALLLIEQVAAVEGSGLRVGNRDVGTGTVGRGGMKPALSHGRFPGVAAE
jgi:hypothetical protein